MFLKFLIKQSSQPSLDVEKLHKLVMELDEYKQESISGGFLVINDTKRYAKVHGENCHKPSN
jgi:hypothetical protein